MRRRDDRVNLCELAHSVPIVDAMKHYIQLVPKNGRYYGLCPFHSDRHLGSFVVFPDNGTKYGYWKCFACGAGGDNIAFVSNFCGVGFREAAIRIAENANLISKDEAEKLRGGFDRDALVHIQRAPVPKKPDLLLSEKRDKEHLDRVYRGFVGACPKLTSEVRAMLLDKRKVPESSLMSYFLYPDYSDASGGFWKKFRYLLGTEFGVWNYDEQDKLLLGVPGFYVRKKNGRIDFPKSPERSLGIIIHDRNGLVSGIQTRALSERKDENGKMVRYKFLSSGMANGSEDSSGTYGCSCGYVEDVLFPAGKKWTRAIAITEGRFKAEALAKLGFVAVNMHSIANWSAAGDVALSLAESVHANRFVLCYDREENGNVTASALGLYRKLAGELTTEFAVWDSGYGKGFDDVVNAGHLDKISRIGAAEYFGATAGVERGLLS